MRSDSASVSLCAFSPFHTCLETGTGLPGLTVDLLLQSMVCVENCLSDNKQCGEVGRALESFWIHVGAASTTTWAGSGPSGTSHTHSTSLHFSHTPQRASLQPPGHATAPLTRCGAPWAQGWLWFPLQPQSPEHGSGSLDGC